MIPPKPFESQQEWEQHVRDGYCPPDERCPQCNSPLLEFAGFNSTGPEILDFELRYWCRVCNLRTTEGEMMNRNSDLIGMSPLPAEPIEMMALTPDEVMTLGTAVLDWVNKHHLDGVFRVMLNDALADVDVYGAELRAIDGGEEKLYPDGRVQYVIAALLYTHGVMTEQWEDKVS